MSLPVKDFTRSHWNLLDGVRNIVIVGSREPNAKQFLGTWIQRTAPRCSATYILTGLPCIAGEIGCAVSLVTDRGIEAHVFSSNLDECINNIIRVSTSSIPLLVILEALPWSVLKGAALKRFYGEHRDHGIVFAHVMESPEKLDTICREQIDAVCVFNTGTDASQCYDIYFSWREWEQIEKEYLEMQDLLSKNGYGIVAIRKNGSVSFYRYRVQPKRACAGTTDSENLPIKQHRNRLPFIGCFT